MKKAGYLHMCIISIAILFGLVAILSSCQNVNYEKAYQNGFDAGYSEAEIDLSYYYSEQLYFDCEELIQDGFFDDHPAFDEYVNEIACDAVFYAKEQGGWHPEEAWDLVKAYQNKESFYPDGSIPSEQDYLDAIDSLIYFYDYFYSERYN